MRAFLSLLLVSLLVIALTGCGGGNMISQAGGGGGAPGQPASSDDSSFESASSDDSSSDDSSSDDSSSDDSSSDDSSLDSGDEISSGEIDSGEIDSGDDAWTEDNGDSTDIAEDTIIEEATDEIIDDVDGVIDGDGAIDGDPGNDGEPTPRKPRTPPPPPKPQTYSQMAIDAFREGDQKKALDFVYAHALFDAAAGSQMKLGWIPAFKRPGLAERWAVGIVYVQDRQYKGPPAEFGQKPPQVLRQQGGGDRRRGGRGQPQINAQAVNRPAPTTYAGVVTYFAGSYGDKVLARLKSAAGSGGFGEVLRVAPQPNPKDLRAEERRNAPRDDGALPEDNVDPPIDDVDAADDIIDEPADEIDVADDDVVDDGAVDDGAVDGGGAQRERREVAVYTGPVGLSPGVSFVGVGPRNELVDRARDDGADVLLILEVSSLLIPSNGVLNTSIVMEAVEPKSGAMLRKSREVNNLAYFVSKQKPGAKDPVDDMVDDFFQYVVDNLYLQPMPPLTPANVEGRIAAVTSQSQPEPLKLLAELLYYRNQDLATNEQLIAAYGALLESPEDGQRLVSGQPAEKKKVLEGLLNRTVDTGPAPGEVDFFGS